MIENRIIDVAEVLEANADAILSAGAEAQMRILKDVFSWGKRYKASETDLNIAAAALNESRGLRELAVFIREGQKNQSKAL